MRASSGESLTRADLSLEAIRLRGCSSTLQPEPETDGLARADAAAGFAPRGARRRRTATSSCSRSRTVRCWNRGQIEEGLALARARWPRADSGLTPCRLPSRRCTPRPRPPRRPTGTASSRLYDLLLEIEPSPVIELNRAAAVAMRDGPAAGLALVTAILGARRARRLPAGACRAGRALPAARRGRQRARDGVPARARADAPGRRAPIPGAPARGAPVRLTCRMPRCRA